MLCDICKKNEATLHLKQTRQGKITEYHLCEPCAQEQGLGQQVQGYMSHLLGQKMNGMGNIFYPAGGIPEFGHPVHENIACPNCGQTYQDFRKTGLFGCSLCYETFGKRLEPVFRKVQGSLTHKGRVMQISQPKDNDQQGLPDDEHEAFPENQNDKTNYRVNPKETEINQLREQLREVVIQEDYEKAAQLRDKIRDMEKSLADQRGEAEA